jgi:hypothetical protein
MKWLKSAEFWCFLLILVNLATAGVDFYFRRSANALVPYPQGQVISSGPLGITAAGNPPSAGRACHLVRYASINCRYCSPRYSQPWNDLERASTAKGCDSTIVTPFAGDFPLDDEKTPRQKLAGVSLQFMKNTGFNSTPITLLVDRDYRIVWSHVGVVEQDDGQQALQAIETLPAATARK